MKSSHSKRNTGSTSRGEISNCEHCGRPLDEGYLRFEDHKIVCLVCWSLLALGNLRGLYSIFKGYKLGNKRRRSFKLEGAYSFTQSEYEAYKKRIKAQEDSSS